MINRANLPNRDVTPRPPHNIIIAHPPPLPLHFTKRILILSHPIQSMISISSPSQHNQPIMCRPLSGDIRLITITAFIRCSDVQVEMETFVARRNLQPVGADLYVSRPIRCWYIRVRRFCLVKCYEGVVLVSRSRGGQGGLGRYRGEIPL